MERLSKCTIMLGVVCVLTCEGAAWASKSPEEGEQIRVYQVNRKVCDFPEQEDFSTPESAYAVINRVMASGERGKWRQISVKSLADRLSPSNAKTEEVNPEYAEALLNARIMEVRIFREQKAVVLAELMWDPNNPKIDKRSLELEDGRWLNKGQDHYASSLEEARAETNAKFAYMLGPVDAWHRGGKDWRQAIQDEQIQQAVKQPEIIEKVAKDFFDKLCQVPPIVGPYQTYTNRPEHRRWIKETFSKNPIVSVELGAAFLDKSERPAVPYKLTLKDGTILEGVLPFQYSAGNKRWYGIEGIDWHLQSDER